MKKLLLLSVFVLVIGAADALAQCREAGSIRFARGRTSATVSGSVSSARAVCYTFRARTGQTLTATLASPGKRVRFSIMPDAYDVDYEIARNTRSWQGRLDGAYGDDYLISIHIPKGSDSYKLTISIR